MSTLELTTWQDELHLIANNEIKTCTKVGKELHFISGLIEKEIQKKHHQSLTQQLTNGILTVIQNHEAAEWEPLFEEMESIINRQVHMNWAGVLKHLRNKYQSLVAVIPQGLGSLRHITVAGGMIGAVAVGVGIWCI